MPRAMALFQHLGMHPIAAPTQFLGFHRTLITAYLPNTNNLVISDIALHEYLGVLWEKMQGYISA
jgi:uncharacterized SAM-binding protein YcdF (DUF218 family)